MRERTNLIIIASAQHSLHHHFSSDAPDRQLRALLHDFFVDSEFLAL